MCASILRKMHSVLKSMIEKCIESELKCEVSMSEMENESTSPTIHLRCCELKIKDNWARSTEEEEFRVGEGKSNTRSVHPSPPGTIATSHYHSQLEESPVHFLSKYRTCVPLNLKRTGRHRQCLAEDRPAPMQYQLVARKAVA